MPELKEGQILTLDDIQNNSYTYKDKTIKFERDPNFQNVYTAKTELSQEEKDAGSLERVFTYNAGTASGTVTSYVLPPNTPVFQQLSDSEKLTRLNSLAFQHNTNEPVDTGDNLDTVLQKNLTTIQPSNKEELQQFQQKQAKALKQQEKEEVKQLKETKKIDAPSNPTEGQAQNKEGGSSKSSSSSSKGTSQNEKDKQINDQIKDEINLAEIKAADA